MHQVTGFSYLKLNTSQNEYLAGACGGVVVRYVAAGTLLTGDTVYISATGSNVNKSTTAANYAAFVGIVVGNDDGIILDTNAAGNAVGIQAATTGQGVLVQISGVANAIVGASTVTAGNRVIASAATAGRILPYTSGAAHCFGVALDTQATAGSPVKIQIRYSNPTA